jgi:hypothetical protein
MVGNSIVRFNKEATRWLGVRMDAHLTFKEHHNQCMKMARAVEARLRVLTKMHVIIPERVRAVLTACVQAIALYGSELWWDPREIGRQEDLQLPLNQQARSTLGALPTTPMGAVLRESGLTPPPVALESQAAMIESEARMRVRRLQTKGSARQTDIGCPKMETYPKGARARPGSRDHALTKPSRRAG